MQWTESLQNQEITVTEDTLPEIDDIFNLDEFILRNVDDLELSRDVARIFISSSPEYIDAIRMAYANRDCVALRQSAHKLNGAASNLSLLLLSEIARKMEIHAKEAELEKAYALIPELEQKLEQALVAICTSLKIQRDKVNQ